MIRLSAGTTTARWEVTRMDAVIQFVPVNTHGLSVCSALLTDNLQCDTRRVLHVLDLHVEIVLPRVFSLRLADEEDGVHVAVPHTSECGF